MNTPLKSRMDAARFFSYVEELRDFAASYRMPVGSSDGLDALQKALESPGPFREECASMIRSVVYRERGNADSDELLALVAAAWGGLRTDGQAEWPRGDRNAIAVFLAGVMRVQRSSPASTPSHHSSEEAEVLLDDRYGSKGTTDIYTVAAETASPTVGASASDFAGVGAGEDLESVDSTLKELEAESPDVQLYLQLLRQRTEKQEEASSSPDLVVLHERTATPTSLSVIPSGVSLVVADARDDPWEENSELRRELRRFAADRELRAAEYRAAKLARSAPIRVLFFVEGVMFRLGARDNPVRRYLSRRLNPAKLLR